ncbi:hypothetical protein GALL_186010 [mine drainage metagenome]|uniref:Copper chaperone PCu(A)C n=1 Tax=mine drainage metagenome TaxID=410659 RepID=A0A1J5S573_9ZZZZ
MQSILSKHFFSKALFLSLAISMINIANAATTGSEIVSIQGAWVRPTNPGQEVGAAYMTLTSSQNVTLVSVESDVTKSVEIHNMSMQNGVMKMRMLDSLPLSAGKPYKLAPGGFHLMLFDLKKPLAIGDQVNFVLNFKTTKNKKPVEFKQQIKATVQSSADENAKH